MAYANATKAYEAAMEAYYGIGEFADTESAACVFDSYYDEYTTTVASDADWAFGIDTGW